MAAMMTIYRLSLDWSVQQLPNRMELCSSTRFQVEWPELSRGKQARSKPKSVYADLMAAHSRKHHSLQLCSELLLAHHCRLVRHIVLDAQCLLWRRMDAILHP
jgi:hypothetical protein